jgi:hypothetical protein
MLEILKIKTEEAHVKLVILPAFFCGKYYRVIPFVTHISQHTNRKSYNYLSLCLYNDKLCYLIYGKKIMGFLTPKPNVKIPYGISFDVTLKNMPNYMPNYMPLNDYNNFVDISHEYDKQYLKELSHSVDVNDNIKIAYEKIVKKFISDPIVHEQLSEFTAIERDYKLKQLINTF